MNAVTVYARKAKKNIINIIKVGINITRKYNFKLVPTVIMTNLFQKLTTQTFLIEVLQSHVQANPNNYWKPPITAPNVD